MERVEAIRPAIRDILSKNDSRSTTRQKRLPPERRPPDPLPEASPSEAISGRVIDITI